MTALRRLALRIERALIRLRLGSDTPAYAQATARLAAPVTPFLPE